MYVILLHGPRASGKTTVLNELAKTTAPILLFDADTFLHWECIHRATVSDHSWFFSFWGDIIKANLAPFEYIQKRSKRPIIVLVCAVLKTLNIANFKITIDTDKSVRDKRVALRSKSRGDPSNVMGLDNAKFEGTHWKVPDLGKIDKKGYESSSSLLTLHNDLVMDMLGFKGEYVDTYNHRQHDFIECEDSVIWLSLLDTIAAKVPNDIQRELSATITT